MIGNELLFWEAIIRIRRWRFQNSLTNRQRNLDDHSFSGISDTPGLIGRCKSVFWITLAETGSRTKETLPGRPCSTHIRFGLWQGATGRSRLRLCDDPDLDSSAALYEQLGFSRFGSNTFPVPWTQLSDGSLMIMMKRTKLLMPSTYYSTHVADIAADLEKQDSIFPEAEAWRSHPALFFTSPDGFSIMLADNIGGFTQSPGQ